MKHVYILLIFIYDILKQDPYLEEVTKEFDTMVKFSQSAAQRCFDYLFMRGKSFVVMEPPWLLDLDLLKARETTGQISS